MTDIDPDREWYYSITIHATDNRRQPEHITGVTDQGVCTTREQLANRIVSGYMGGWGKVDSIEVHSLERNDL